MYKALFNCIILQRSDSVWSIRLNNVGRHFRRVIDKIQSMRRVGTDILKGSIIKGWLIKLGLYTTEKYLGKVTNGKSFK